VTEPTPLTELLGDLLSGLGVANPDDAVALVDKWQSLAPTPWSDRARPLTLRGGVLEVEVADGTTASLLRYQERQLLDHLAATLGSGLVDTVKIIVNRH